MKLYLSMITKCTSSLLIIKLHTIKRQLIFTGTKRKKAYDIHIIK